MLNPFGKRLTEVQATELLDSDVVGMVAGVEPLTEKVIRGASSLKVIARCGSGLDNVDLSVAQRLGISVFNTPDAPTQAVAELTLAHILSLIRRISECDRAIRAAHWKALMGSLLASQTVGVVGYGRIGRKVSRLLQAFGTRVLVCDSAPIGEEEDGIEVVSLETLLSSSDIVTLHLPYSAGTHHFINAKRLSLMKSTARLVNVSRGGLVDEIALIDVLQAGRLQGAALDCFESEPYSGPLSRCENVQLTAHMGSYAREARAMMEAQACDALLHGLRQHGLL